MRKYAYLAQLEELLAPLPAQERQEALNYYEEYFDAAGSEKEEQTAAELGDPAEVARKILEGEGIEAPEDSSPAPGPRQDADAANAPAMPAADVPDTSEVPPPTGDSPSDGPGSVSPADPETPEAPAPEPPAPDAEKADPQPPLAPPAGPEPPPLADPEHYPAKGTGRSRRPIPRLWLVFWLLILLALVIQVGALVFGLGGLSLGGSAAFMTASSESVGPVPTAPAAESAPADSLQASGPVTYSATLQDLDGYSTLNIRVMQGNVAFRTGDTPRVEVRNVDASHTVDLSYDGTACTLSCDSNDPQTHITVVLPPWTFRYIDVQIQGSGAIELGDLQALSVRATTAKGPIQSGSVAAGSLYLFTGEGNIWLESVLDDAQHGQCVETVTLLAPKGSVNADLPGAQGEWQIIITAPGGAVEEDTSSGTAGDQTRALEVEAGKGAGIEYGAA